MKRTKPAPPPAPPSPVWDPPAILARARRLLYALQADPTKARAIDKAAAEAVTAGRHGDAGAEFADGILRQLRTIGDVISEAAVDVAIMGTLTRPPQTRRTP